MEERLSEKSKILDRLEMKEIGKNVPGEAPKVSIVIPAYNVSKLISETLDSIFSQTFKDFEVIVVCDGSVDHDELLIALTEYLDDIVYARQANSGTSKARNLAICLSRGEYIAFLDADDIWLPKKLETQIKFIENTNFDLVYCDAEFFGETYGKGNFMEASPSTGEVTPVSLINAQCNVITSGTLLKREKLEEYGLFDSEGDSFEDFDLWFRLAKNGIKIGYRKDILLKYRLSSTSLSGSNVARAERNVTALEFVARKYELTREEQDVVDEQIAFAEAEVELEKGKFWLTRERFSKAKDHIAAANEYYKKPKLLLIEWMLRLFPSLTLKLFKRLRPNEFSFISNHQKM